MRPETKSPRRRPHAVLAAALLAGLLGAAAAPAQSLKIGVFDKQRIVDESSLGQAQKARFERLQGAREAEVNEKQKAFEALQQSYGQKASVLSDEKKLELQRELARARDEWQSAVNNADRDLGRAYQQALLEIVAKIDPVVTDYGRANGYDFLFDASQKQVEYWKQAHDVTDDLIAKLNAKHP